MRHRRTADGTSAIDGERPSPAGTILEAREVTKTYRTSTFEVPALRGVDLTIRPGEMVAVMGASGSGKTTLLNCLSGLDDIDGGRVAVAGVDLGSLSDAARTEHRAREMGFIFQSFNLIPVLSAAENVELPLLLAGARPAIARGRAEAFLERVGLGGRLHHRPNELSGGEQQRVAIARALVTEPAIVWADEPTGNLDSHTAAVVMDLLADVNRAGQTIVLVTHDPAVAARADRLVRMQDGAVVVDTPARELVGDAAPR